MAKHTEHGYGYYPGGDPRKFSPDPECSTEEERARHKSACEAWDRGDTPDPGGPHIPIGTPLPEGTEPVTTNPACGHITVAHYGLGTYTFEYDCDGPEACHDCAFDELTRLRTENADLRREKDSALGEMESARAAHNREQAERLKAEGERQRMANWLEVAQAQVKALEADLAALRKKG